MAPGTRRAGRGGHAEHDDFEGLPVRQWRQEWVSVAPPVQQDIQPKSDIWAVECLYGMPKDIDLLPSHSQALLRAARSGMLYKRPSAPEDDEADAEAALPEKTEKKEEDAEDKGYTIKLWKQIPRNVEASDISRLAKRRKGTVTIASKTIETKVQGPTVTRATVRRTDAAGNPYTEEVTLTEGAHVDGEIISTRVEPAAPTAPELMPPAPPQNRRRPPPPKRKPKAGPGRGKKKAKILPPGENGVVPGLAADGTTIVKSEGGEQTEPRKDGEGGEGTPNNGSEMADDDDDDEDGEEGEDGDEGDDSEVRTPAAADTSINGEDTEMTDSTPAAVHTQLAEQADVEMKDDDSPTKAAPPNPLTLAPPVASLAAGSPKVEGSPLKNVVLPSPTTEAPPPLETKVLSPLLPSQPDEAAATESLVAEPPSTLVGEEPIAAIERDVPRAMSTTDEALLPPPPDQVGNISSPKAEEAPEKPAENDEKPSDTQPQDEVMPERPPLVGYDSVMTDDSIRPDDSASTHIVSAAPSEIDTSSIADAPAAVAPKAVSPAEDAKEPSPAKDIESEGKADLLGGLMGELDRQASNKPEQPKEETPKEATPFAEAEPAPAVEPVSEPKAASQEPEKKEVSSPKQESVPEFSPMAAAIANNDDETEKSPAQPAPEPATVEAPDTDSKEEVAAEPVVPEKSPVEDVLQPEEAPAAASVSEPKDDSPAVKEEVNEKNDNE
ncbi:hypothetical protein CC79DRAFT_1330481 [Sarocladium strictum]